MRPPASSNRCSRLVRFYSSEPCNLRRKSLKRFVLIAVTVAFMAEAGGSPAKPAGMEKPKDANSDAGKDKPAEAGKTEKAPAKAKGADAAKEKTAEPGKSGSK